MSHIYERFDPVEEDIFSEKNYLKKTWTGKILIINALFFVVLSILSRDFLSPRNDLLLAFGAKNPIGIAKGHWWLFISPIFNHIGIIHFLVNSAALKYIGRVIERLLGGKWFLFIYLITGIAGNIASSFANTAVGAGASGAIFGLIGAGLSIEIFSTLRYRHHENVVKKPGKNRLINFLNHRFPLISGPFALMAILNILFAITVNFILSLSDSVSIGIDNAAHIGGLITGFILGTTFLLIRPNILLKVQKKIAYSIILCLLLTLSAAGKYLSKSNHIMNLFKGQGKAAEDQWTSVIHYSRAIEIKPLDAELRYLRGAALLKSSKYEDQAIKDLGYAAGFPIYREKLESLKEELSNSDNKRSELILNQIIELSKKSSL